MNPLFKRPKDDAAWIKVIGVGGGGGNAVARMMKHAIRDVELIVCDTDAESLGKSSMPLKVQIGGQLTCGQGAGANPEVGRKAALEDIDAIRAMLEGADMVFVIAGMGGGTGTGASPLIADMAKKLGILTMGVVTTPFIFEGQECSKRAEDGLDELHKAEICLFTIPKQLLLEEADKDTVRRAYWDADMALFNTVRRISEFILLPSHHGNVFLDFADVKIVLGEKGHALIGTGHGIGENGARDATQKAIGVTPFECNSIERARGIVVNVTGGENLMLYDVNDAVVEIQKRAQEPFNLIFNYQLDLNMKDELAVTVIATGFPAP